MARFCNRLIGFVFPDDCPVVGFASGTTGSGMDPMVSSIEPQADGRAQAENDLPRSP